MVTRRMALQGLAAGVGLGACGTARAQSDWTVPSNDAIQALLAERIDAQGRGVGIAVGVIEPAGRRTIAHGVTDVRDPEPVDGDTIFQIGSVSKVFATLVLSDAVLRGEMRLEDPAERYLPGGVRMPRNGREVTLNDLATHLSGLPSMPTNFDLRADPNPVAAYSPRQLYAFLNGYAPAHEPGAAFVYSNLGVALLGRLMADRAGLTYEQLVSERVLRPLGLSSTSITLSRDQRRRLAAGHDMYLRPVDSWEMRTLQASGSLRSSAKDLTALLAAHLGYHDTPAAAALRFQTHQPRPATGPAQSLGFAIRGLPGGGVNFLHDGGKAGYRSLIAFDPAARTGVVVLANARSIDNLSDLTLHLLTGRAMAPTSAMPPPPPLPKIVPLRGGGAFNGRYTMADGAQLEMACKGDRLLVNTFGEDVDEYFHGGEGTFHSRTTPRSVHIERAGTALFREGEAELSAHRTGPLRPI